MGKSREAQMSCIASNREIWNLTEIQFRADAGQSFGGNFLNISLIALFT
jgi:hypothetical protein